MNPAAAIDEVARLVERHGASNDVRVWLAEQRRATVVLLFREAGVDAAGRSLFEVGDAGKLVTFAAGGEGVGWWLKALQNQPAGVALADRSPDASRKLLSRALDELDRAAPRLASELRRNGKVMRGVVIYCKAINSPRIDTE